MKIGIRELALLAIGFAMGAVAGTLLASATSRLAHGVSAQPKSDADPTTARYFNTLLAATKASDYGQFVSVADDAFRSSLTPTRFQSICQSLAPRFRGGWTPTYLGQLWQNGNQVSLWRLVFADGSEDRLARMSMSQERVGGFLITPAF